MNTRSKIMSWKGKEKKRRMRILGARIFLSLLAGKFNHFQTDVTEKQSLKNLSMRVANTRIFSKFFGGKIKFLNSRLLGSYDNDQKNSTGLNRFFGIFANKIDLSLMKNQLRCFQKTLDLFCCRIFFLPLTCPLFCI